MSFRFEQKPNLLKSDEQLFWFYSSNGWTYFNAAFTRLFPQYKLCIESSDLPIFIYNVTQKVKRLYQTFLKKWRKLFYTYFPPLRNTWETLILILSQIIFLIIIFFLFQKETISRNSIVWNTFLSYYFQCHYQK